MYCIIRLTFIMRCFSFILFVVQMKIKVASLITQLLNVILTKVITFWNFEVDFDRFNGIFEYKILF